MRLLTCAASGSAFVFTRNGGGVWTEQAKLTAADAEFDTGFGRSVSVDGDIAIIGASHCKRGRGAAYLFERDGAGNSREKSKFRPSDAVRGDLVADIVAYSGNTALLGLSLHDHQGPDAGAAYFFDLDP